MTSKHITLAEFRERLREAGSRVGSLNKWCHLNGIAQPVASMVLTGKRPPPKALCKALGIRRETIYIEEKGNASKSVPPNGRGTNKKAR